MNSNLINFRNRSICGLALAWVMLTSQSAVGGLITINGDEVTFNETLTPASGWTEIFGFDDMTGTITNIEYEGLWANEPGSALSYRDDLVVLLEDRTKPGTGSGVYKTVLAIGSSQTIGGSNSTKTVNNIGAQSGTSVLFADDAIEARWTEPANNGTEATSAFTMNVNTAYDPSTGSTRRSWSSALATIGDASNFRAYIGHGYWNVVGTDRQTTWNGKLTFSGASEASSGGTVPEPATATIFAIGMIGVVSLRRRRR